MRRKAQDELGAAITAFTLIMMPLIVSVIIMVVNYGFLLHGRIRIEESVQAAAQTAIREQYGHGGMTPNSFTVASNEFHRLRDTERKDTYCGTKTFQVRYGYVTPGKRTGATKLTSWYTAKPAPATTFLSNVYNYVEVRVTDGVKDIWGNGCTSITTTKNAIIFTEDMR